MDLTIIQKNYTLSINVLPVFLYFRATGKSLMILVVLLTGISCPILYGQTVVRGRVTDASTFEPIVFANVIYKGTTIGVQTEFGGNFTLSGKTTSDSIVISFIGYDSKNLFIRRDTINTIDVQLKPALYALMEVKVMPGENPAHSLLRKVWKNSEHNRIDKLSAYQYKNYSRSTVYLRKFSRKPDDKRVLDPFATEFEKYSIKTGNENIPALPSYITESISDNYFLKSPKREYTHIKATNSKGIAFENTDLFAQLVNLQENIYFPDNNVTMFDKSFISPLSHFGMLYYKFYLVDTLFLEDKYYCYEIKVLPKREEDPVFRGSIWINDTTFALKRISVEIGEKSELNFIQRIKIQQDYEPVDSKAWFPVKTRLMADAVNIFVNNYSEKSDIIVNEPFDPGFYGSELKIDFASRNYGEDYWNQNRLNSLDRIDTLAFQRIDYLKDSKKTRITGKLIEASVKGYYNLGWFEWGPLLMTYNNNPVEGNRFRFGGRTNAIFSQNTLMEGYLAYGFNDSRFKGSFQPEFILSKPHWTKIGFQFRDDIENVGSLDEFYSESRFLTFATTFGGSDKMDVSQVIRGWLESDLFKGMTGKMIFTRKTFHPVSPDFYFAWYTDETKTTLSSDFTTSEFAFILRYQPKATYVLDGLRRFPLNFNKYPIFSIEYFRGFRGLFQSDFNYRKVVAEIKHKFNLGGIGSFGYDLRFTKVLDQLPYPLLITLAGNESVFRSDRTYNLMNYGEFVLDEALELFVDYHMNGLILNKIPVLKKLQWRTVVTANAAFGSFNESLNGFYDPIENPMGILPYYVNDNPLTSFKTLTCNDPYLELSYGIENIFRFVRIDVVQRITKLEDPYTQRFRLKFSGVFRF
jgi:hypothetical protein